jgi:hypothetical protein
MSKHTNAHIKVRKAKARGVHTLRIIGPREPPPLLAAAIAGNPVANLVLRAVNDTLEALHRSEGENPECLLCGEGPGTQPPFLALLVEANRNYAVMHAICPACHDLYSTDAAVQRAVLESYQARGVTDLRLLPPFGQAGRA